MGIASRLSSAWSTLRGRPKAVTGIRHRDTSRPGNRPGEDGDSSRVQAIEKGYYGLIRSALRASVPGGWAADHYEETLHFTGWNYIAGHATALQCAGASVEVSRPIDFAPDAWTGKCVRKLLPRSRSGRQTYLQPLSKSHDQAETEHRDILPETFDLCRLLNRPNESQSGAHQRYEISVQLSQTGTALVVKIPNRFGKTVETYVLPTCLMTPRPANSQYPFGAYYVSPAATRTNWADDSFVTMVGYQRLAGTIIDMRDVIKISFPHPLWKDEGYSALAAGALWSDAAEQIDRSRFMKMYNNADPSLIIKPQEGMNPNDNEIERVVQLLASMYGGPTKAGRIMVAPGGCEVEQLGVTPRDMDYNAAFDQLRNAIMGIHGVPLIAAGITDGGSYAAFYAALKQFIMLCVQPRLDWIAEELTYQLAIEYGEDLMVRLIGQGVDDPAVLEARLATDISARAVTKNEVRQLRGLEPRDDGDVWVGEKETIRLDSADSPQQTAELAGASDGGDETSTGISTGQKKPSSPASHFEQAQRAGNPQIGLGKRMHDEHGAGTIADMANAARIRESLRPVEIDPYVDQEGSELARQRETHFIVYRSEAGHWYWRLIAENGEPVADSGEGYVNQADCLAAVAQVRGSNHYPVFVSDEKVQQAVQPDLAARMKCFESEIEQLRNTVADDQQIAKNRWELLVHRQMLNGKNGSGHHKAGGDHDVSGEARDDHGQWTSGGGGGGGTSTKPSKPTEAAKPKPQAKPSLAELSKPAAKPSERPSLQAARREGKGKDARVIMEDGKPAPAHIKPSMVPPQWTDVHVATDENSDVLVRARDAKGRIKTVYSDNFTMRQAAKKFSRVSELVAKHAQIVDQNHQNRKSADAKTREAADCLWLIQEQGTRPGSDSDTKAKVKAYGATTLRAEHIVQDEDGSVRLDFIGKEGIHHNHTIRNPELAKMLVDRKASAGKRGGKLFETSDTALRDYTRTLDGGDYTPKDFRTAKATLLAAATMKELGGCCRDKKEYKAAVKHVATVVSSVLGNRPQQAIESYINPTVWSAWRCPDCA